MAEGQESVEESRAGQEKATEVVIDSFCRRFLTRSHWNSHGLSLLTAASTQIELLERLGSLESHKSTFFRNR